MLENSENSGIGSYFNSDATTFRLGDDATKRQYRGILSFNTARLPDNAIITGVTLQVKKQSVVGGGNPVSMFNGFVVDVKLGTFGASTLQSADFQTISSHVYGPFSPAAVSNWYSIDLTAGSSFINKLTDSSGLTQIRLRFSLDDNNNAVANYLSLYSGDAVLATDRPQLVITYHLP